MSHPTRTVSDPRPERRRSTRFPCGFQSRHHLIVHLGEDPRPLEARNLSIGGIGLVASRSLTPSTRVTIRLYDTRRQDAHILPARVIHCLDLPSGDVYLGCAFFQELAEETLLRLL